MTKRGRPKKQPLNADGLDYGPVHRQIQAAIRLGWPFSVEGNRVRMQAPTGFNERDAARFAETWLGTMFARRLIDRPEFEAGIQFQTTAWRAFGRPFAAAQGGTHGGDEPERAGSQLFTIRCKAVLASRSRRVHDDVVNLCQYDRRPSERETGRIREGLSALADMIGLRKVA